MKKLVLGLMLAALGANAELVDINGAKVERNTPYDIVDGESGTVGDFLDVGGFAMQTNVYDKSETDAKIDEKVSALDFYKKSEVDAKIADEGVKRQSGDADAIKTAKTYIDDKLKTYEASPNYAAVSNAAMTALQPAATNGLATAAALADKANANDVYKKTETYSQTEIDTKVANATPSDYATVKSNAMSAVQSETDPKFDEWKDGTAIAIGRDSVAKPSGVSTNMVAVGYGAKAAARFDTAVGNSATASGTSSSAVGNSATASGTGSSAVGNSATASGAYSSAVGRNAKASGTSSSAVGWNAKASGAYSTSVRGTANGYYSTAVGRGTANGTNSVAVGYGATADGSYAVAIGDGSPTGPLVYEVFTNVTTTVTEIPLDDGSVSNAVVEVTEIVTNSSATAVGYANAAGIHSLALGYMAYAPAEAMGFAYDPAHVYLCSSNTTANAGATARSLQSYLDERAKRYALASPASASISAADGSLYALTADTNGVTVTLPTALTGYAQDFVMRVVSADTNGTHIAGISNLTANVDFPMGDVREPGSLKGTNYVTFTQTTKDTWSIGYFAATKEEE